MAKIKIAETEQIKRWKEIILAILQSEYKDGMTEEEFTEKYPTANLATVKKAVLELVAEGKVTMTL